MKYTFYNSDIEGDAEYDIVGDDFKELLDICFSYCTTLSFLNRQDSEQFQKLEPYRIPKPSNLDTSDCYVEQERYHYYRICPELKDAILSISDHLFQFIDGWGYHNPDDPSFYRADGSAFLVSVIHEGLCHIYPREGEDVTPILKKGIWYVNAPGHHYWSPAEDSEIYK